MDPISNPYAPGAGTPPPVLAGRQDILEHSAIAIARIKKGMPQKSFIAVGLRGVGKTVILRKIREQAVQAAYEIAFTEATDNTNFKQELVIKMRSILIRLSAKEKASALIKKAIGAFKSFASSIKVSYQDFALEISPMEGEADSGDLACDLPDLFEAIGRAAKETSSAIALLIDEIQYLHPEEMSALIMAIHRCNQCSLPIALFGAGLPQLLGKIGDAKSYAERLFDFPEIGALSQKDAKTALQEPAQKEGASYSDEALNFITETTQGYPYFLQEWGHAVWETAAKTPFSKHNAEQASQLAIERLDKSFFRVRLERTTPLQKQYMHAMASLGNGAHRSGDIAKRMGMHVRSAAPTRGQLIAKGMVYSPHHGDTAFTVPLFADFMRREMGEFSKTTSSKKKK